MTPFGPQRRRHRLPSVLSVSTHLRLNMAEVTHDDHMVSEEKRKTHTCKVVRRPPSPSPKLGEGDRGGVVKYPADSLYMQLLKVMLVFELVGIPAAEANLALGLNLQIKDKKLLSNALKLLTQQKVIFFNKTANVYEFRRGADIDWDNVIHAEKLRLVETNEFDAAREFLSTYPVAGL